MIEVITGKTCSPEMVYIFQDYAFLNLAYSLKCVKHPQWLDTSCSLMVTEMALKK